MYPLVGELADDEVDVAVACRVLTVSRSGYYDWLGRPASLRDQENKYLLKQIERFHADSRETYGSLRVHAELTLGLGLSVNLKRVARLLRAAGIQGLYRRRRRGCTLRDPTAEPSGDLVKRQFTVEGPNRYGSPLSPSIPPWKARCTARPSWTPIPGSSSAGPLPTTCAPNSSPTRSPVAILRRQPEKRPGDERTILHSDHGCQYTSWTFGKRLRAAGLLASMGTIGDCYDNGVPRMLKGMVAV